LPLTENTNPTRKSKDLRAWDDWFEFDAVAEMESGWRQGSLGIQTAML
jgi:hypothetical protein